MPELLDRDDRRAYYFGRRTVEKRLFIDKKLALSNLRHKELLACHPERWAHLVKSIAL